jgi:hypothetical protein
VDLGARSGWNSLPAALRIDGLLHFFTRDSASVYHLLIRGTPLGRGVSAFWPTCAAIC